METSENLRDLSSHEQLAILEARIRRMTATEPDEFFSPEVLAQMKYLRKTGKFLIYTRNISWAFFGFIGAYMSVDPNHSLQTVMFIVIFLALRLLAYLTWYFLISDVIISAGSETLYFRVVQYLFGEELY